MNLFKRLSLILLAMMLFVTSLGVTLTAYAEQETPYVEEDPEEPYTNVLFVTAGLTFSGNTAHCAVTMEPQHGENCTMTIRLQKVTPNGWSTLKTWYRSGTSIRLVESASVGAGIFRVYATGYAGDEYVSIVSNTVTNI